MWIDSVTLVSLLMVPVTARTLSRGWPALRQQLSLASVSVLALAVTLLALVDFGAFRVYVQGSGVIRFDTARYQALEHLAASADGLIAPGPCLDPKEVKIVTRRPVAYYNAGLAWPANKPAIDAVMTSTANGVLDPEAMRAARIRFIVTDSACDTRWDVTKSIDATKLEEIGYADDAGSGTLTLWRLM